MQEVVVDPPKTQKGKPRGERDGGGRMNARRMFSRVLLLLVVRSRESAE